MTKSSKRTKAFTLIEFLLAMTLTAIVLTIVYGALVATVTTKKEVERLTLDDRGIEGLFRRMMLEFKGIPAPFGQRVLLGIRGTSSPRWDRLDFITGSAPVYSQGNPAFVHEVGYYINTDENGKTWLYRREEDGRDSNLLEGGVARKVLGGVKSLEISYYQREEWEDQWTKTSLPLLIKVKLTLQVGGETGEETSEEERSAEGETTEGEKSFSFVIPLMAGRTK